MQLKKASYILLGVTLSVILFIVFSPKAEGISNNPCSPCHPSPYGAYDQFLDILENDVQTQIPSEIDTEQIKTVSVIIENGGTPGEYDIISDVSLSLSSQHGFFSVDSITHNMGEMALGKRSAVWQITGLTDGFDTILISGTGTNLHGPSQFSDSYSIPITVGQPTSTPTPTPTQTPTPTPTQTPTPTPTQTPTPTPTPIINQLSVIFQSPKEKEKWSSLTNQNISWLTNGGTPPLRIKLEYLTLNTSELWTRIANNIANNGSLAWKIPNKNGTINLRITIFDSSRPPQTAMSMVNIQVTEPIPEFSTILMPIILMGAISIIIIFKRTLKKTSNIIN